MYNSNAREDLFMTTIIFIISYIISFGLSVIYLNPYLFILWIFTSYIIAFLIVVIFYLFNLPLVLILKSTNPYKTYLMESLAAFLNRCVLNMKIEVIGLENVPRTDPFVAYANHKSYTDAFALMHYFPRPLTLTPKKSVLKIPLLRLWLKAYDVFPINRDNPRETLRDLDNAVKVVLNNQIILLFPEGTIRYRENEFVEEAKAGAFRILKKAEVGFLPIRYDGNDLVRHRFPRRTHRKITIFPFIPFKVIKDMTTIEISKMFMDIVNKKQNYIS